MGEDKLTRKFDGTGQASKALADHVDEEDKLNNDSLLSSAPSGHSRLIMNHGLLVRM